VDGPIFDNQGKQVGTRTGTEVTSLDGKNSYFVDRIGNMIDKRTGRTVGRLIPPGRYLLDGRPSPTQEIL
jgi:hypothetical protein